MAAICGKYIGTGSFGSESIMALYVLDIGTLFGLIRKAVRKLFELGKR